MQITAYQIWFIAAALLAGVEMLSGTFYLAVLSLAAVGSGAAALYGVSVNVQFGITVVITILGSVVARRLKNAKHPELGCLDAGNPVEWIAATADGSWRVRYRGTEWLARPLTADTSPEKPLIINDTKGNILIVKNPDTAGI